MIRQNVFQKLARNITRCFSSKTLFLQLSRLRISPDRDQYSLVLETLQLQITDALKAEKSHEKVSNLKMRLRLSHFLQAVFLGDYFSALQDLEYFRGRCLSSEKGARIYMTCFITLLTQAIRPAKPKLQMLEITAIITAAESFPKRVKLALEGSYMKDIICLIFLVLLRMLSATPERNNIAQLNFVAYIRDLLDQFSVDCDEILAKITDTSPYLIPQYNQVFQKRETGPEDPDEDYVMLRNALESMKSENRTLSYDSLCKYIENYSFDSSKYHSRTTMKDPKFSEVYDALEPGKKAEFMDEYLKFNYKKQLLVEDASQNLYKSVSSLGKMLGFTLLHKTWICGWLEATNCKLRDRLDKNDADLEKFAFVFSVLSVEHVSSMCLTHMLSATVSTTHAIVLPLSNKIGWSLRQELLMVDKVIFGSKQPYEYFSADQAIELACSIMHTIIGSCVLPRMSEATVLQRDEDWQGKVFQFCLVKNKENCSKRARYGAIKVHPVVAQHYTIYQELFQTGAYNLPMLHPPKQWTSPKDGGFFFTRLSLVKSSERYTLDAYMEKARRTGQLSSVYASVNALGACAWTVNPCTLTIFNEMMQKLEIPELLATLTPHMQENPVKPERADFADTDDKGFHRALRKWKHGEAEIRKKRNAAHGMRVYYTIVNRLANSFALKGEILYLPHTMDFRGRVYPAVSLLSHQGEDLVRSLLMFWEAKPLGSEGYNWLTYQLANLYSKTKMTMEQLTEFVEKHKVSISQCAQTPLHANLWWLKADNPWQVLALCYEFERIWAFPGDVSAYKTRIPVHQDGSCNGLQHYSALGADIEAARAVNVLPDASMQDIYNTVLKLVQNRIREDETHLKPFSDLAQSLLSRKLVKQTVMTTVYGVTPYGATKQVWMRIDEHTVAENRDVSDEEKLKLAAYIARHILDSISGLFAGAKLIQNWLVDNCARCIRAYDVREFPAGAQIDFFSGKHFRPMMWTALSGFPVIQMYRKRAKRVLQNPLQKLILNDDTQLAPIDKVKLENGMAPNFIHSIDAIHLLMTCLSAKSKKITFASVHDSFWTHPSEVPVLSTIIREEFARLHSSDIIGNLRLDLVHINRNSCQLVWVNIAENQDFVAEVAKVRLGYTVKRGIILHLHWLNLCLQTELCGGKTATMTDLVDKFRPSLLWKQTPSSGAVVYNSASKPESLDDVKISLKTHVPILVPVQVLEPPPVGNLDIQAVLHSKYFFS